MVKLSCSVEHCHTLAGFTVHGTGCAQLLPGRPDVCRTRLDWTAATYYYTLCAAALLSTNII